MQVSIGNPCPYCGAAMTLKEIQCEHKEPTCRGGSYCFWNLEFTCEDCNKAKGALTSEEFRALLDALFDYPKARLNVLRRLRAGARAGRFSSSVVCVHGSRMTCVQRGAEVRTEARLPWPRCRP